jgi:2-(1,2-epoxy-1,2-dihydrophenyl)acetyl-CoA isomerase
MSDNLQYKKENGIAWIIMNRPEKLNALVQEMMDGILESLKDADADSKVRAVIITGKGRGFCVGEDLAWLAKWAEDYHERRRSIPAPAGRIPLTVLQLSKPTIGGINGYAVGLGCDLALACDFRIVAENAQFGEMYIKRGITPGIGMWLLPRIVGLAKANEMIMLGDMVDAHEALKIGLANKVVPADKLFNEAEALAKRLVNGPALALRFCKSGIYKALETDVSTYLELAAYHRFVIQQSPDALEGVRSFYEKRDPKYL